MEMRDSKATGGAPEDGRAPGLPPWLWIGGLVLLVLLILPLLLQ